LAGKTRGVGERYLEKERERKRDMEKENMCKYKKE
jgi:hypothetical protein